MLFAGIPAEDRRNRVQKRGRCPLANTQAKSAWQVQVHRENVYKTATARSGGSFSQCSCCGLPCEQGHWRRQELDHKEVHLITDPLLTATTRLVKGVARYRWLEHFCWQCKMKGLGSVSRPGCVTHPESSLAQCRCRPKCSVWASLLAGKYWRVPASKEKFESSSIPPKLGSQSPAAAHSPVHPRTVKSSSNLPIC